MEKKVVCQLFLVLMLAGDFFFPRESLRALFYFLLRANTIALGNNSVIPNDRRICSRLLLMPNICWNWRTRWSAGRLISAWLWYYDEVTFSLRKWFTIKERLRRRLHVSDMTACVFFFWINVQNEKEKKKPREPDKGTIVYQHLLRRKQYHELARTSLFRNRCQIAAV